MKKFFNYLGFILEVEITGGEVVFVDINFDPGLKKSNFEEISFDELLNMNIDLSGFSIFEKKVLEKVREIPSGNVMTYKEVAEAVGCKRASRAVGNVMAKNPFPILIPCHRVIKSDLSLGNYSRGGEKNKKRLLKREGVEFEDNKVIFLKPNP